MKRFFWFLVKLVLILVLIAGAGVAITGRDRVLELAFGPPDLSAVDFRTLQLTAEPNQYLVCPTDYCTARPHRVSPVFDMPAEALRDRWMAMIETRPRVEPWTADDRQMQYHFIAYSLVFAFPDSISVRFLPLGGGRSTLAIYSRSHYGRDDFGVNGKRIREWLALLSQG